MEKKDDDITKKIRSSIEKKLVEIHAFVDDELPHYIMLLIANKRSKSQFQKDLNLFLGDDTANFTDWLWDLLTNIRVNSKENAAVLPTKKREKELVKNTEAISDDDTDVLNYNPDEQDTLEQEENKKSDQKLIEVQVKPKAITSPPVVQVQSIKQELIQKEISPQKSVQKSAKVYPMQHSSPIKPTSTIVQVPKSVKALKAATRTEDAYDPSKPAVSGSVSSIVRVSKRKYNCPASLQANKLLLRAMNDATKSVLKGCDMKEFYKPTPLKVLSCNKTDTIIPTVQNAENIIEPPPENIKVLPDYSENIQDVMDSVQVYPKQLESKSLSEPECAVPDMIHQTIPQFNRTIYLPSEIQLENSSENNPKFSIANDIIMEEIIEEDAEDRSPHFIVTLDGVEFPTLKRRYSDVEEEEDMELDEDVFISDDPSPKKHKITERCKYWPACKNSDSCSYYHPMVPCKCFPNCKFGDKCLYIHPNCKFDALCSRKDCPYTHASKRKYPLPSKAAKSAKIHPPSNIVCKFYPKCTAKHCPFIHPKPCRYGTTCRLPVCSYSHFKVPPKNQLKWKAEHA